MRKIHWRGGSPDSFVEKPVATRGPFVFGVGTVAFTQLAPDRMTSTPGGANASVLFFGVVFAWVEGTIVLWNLGYRFDVGLAVLSILILAGALVTYAHLGGPFR